MRMLLLSKNNLIALYVPLPSILIFKIHFAVLLLTKLILFILYYTVVALSVEPVAATVATHTRTDNDYGPCDPGAVSVELPLSVRL